MPTTRFRAVGRMCRREIDGRIQSIKARFQFAVTNEYVPASVGHGLASVPNADWLVEPVLKRLRPSRPTVTR
jgi:hypothetical protein